MKIWGNTASSQSGLFYFQSTQIGRYDGNTWDDDYSATVPTGATGIGTMNWPTPHLFNGNMYFSISQTNKIGALIDDGAGGITLETDVFDYDSKYSSFAIADDGQYLVIVASQNQEGADLFANNKVYFWDTFSSSWARDYDIKDPFIWKVQRMGNLVYCFGQYGIYEVSFGGGVKKILSRSTGFGTPNDVVLGYGTQRATTYNQEALMWATDTTIDTLGKLDPSLPSAYFKPFKVPAGVGTPTLVFTEFAAGSVYVATDGDKLYRYDFNGATRDTGTAQTIYFPVNAKVLVNRIDVIFGEPLDTNDVFEVNTILDEDTGPASFGSASFANDGQIRRKSLYPDVGVQVDEQFSLSLAWSAGAAKIKRIEVYGQPMTP